MDKRQLIRNKLKSDGEVTRNWAIRNYITRLAADIDIIKKKNKWDITGETQGGDYVYKLISTPEYSRVKPREGLFRDIAQRTSNFKQPE